MWLGNYIICVAGSYVASCLRRCIAPAGYVYNRLVQCGWLIGWLPTSSYVAGWLAGAVGGWLARQPVAGNVVTYVTLADWLVFGI